MMQIIIGREGNQPFKITDEYVSRRHAIFTYDETTGIMTLINQADSGTYIKVGGAFQPIPGQCNVSATTDVRLGPFFTFRVGQLFQTPQVNKPQPQPKPKPQEKPKPQRADIAYLRRVAEEYEQTKMNLEQKQAMVNNLRTMSMVGSLLGGTLGALLPGIMGSDELVYKVIGPVIAVIFLVSLMIYCSQASKDVIAKKNKNEKNYKITFCCPQCHVPFAGKLYENILAEGKCPKCKTEFYDSNI